jgi:predicted AAA+ superfamily ATPase
VGKTTLARAIADKRGSGAIYLDLESAADRNRLNDPEAYFTAHADKLVVLDEIHRAPEIFAILRGQIDARRRAGREGGHFLILGSAALDLMKQASESLAGRIVHLEMPPIQPQELVANDGDIDLLWERGGFPRSFLAADDEASLVWRQAFIRSYLERDIPQFGIRVPAQTLERFWTMLAHGQGGLLNAQRLAHSLDANWHSVMHYLDLMCDLLLVRRLSPWARNEGKRLVKSPKVYVRDSGLLHTLLGLGSLNDVLGHPVAGASWEGFVIEALIAAAPTATRAYFYRTQAGAEVDLVLEFSADRRWAIEIKKSSAPTIGKGFTIASDDLSAERRIVVHKGGDSYPMRGGVEAMTLLDAVTAVKQANVGVGNNVGT